MAAIRLVDGSPPYEAEFGAALTPATAARMAATLMTVPYPVRVDPLCRGRVRLSLGEPVPVVPYDNPAALARSRRALASGTEHTLREIVVKRQFLRLPTDEEVYGIGGRLDDGTAVLAGFLPVPEPARRWLESRSELRLRLLTDDSEAAAIDWQAARDLNGPAPGAG